MNKTLTFIRLDYITVKPYLTLKNLFLFGFIILFIGVGTGNGAMIIGMLMMYGTFYTSYPFAVCEQNGLDILYSTLPLTKRSIVTGRYLFALILNLMLGLASFLLTAAIMFISRKPFSVREMLATVLLCFVLYTIIQAIQLPIYFKMGYTKAKFLSYLPLMAFPVVVIGAGKILGEENVVPTLQAAGSWLAENMILAAALVFLLWLAAMLVSWAVSYKSYNKREF